MALALSTVVLFSLASCELITKTEEGKMKEAVAKVNGYTITRSEFLKRFETEKAKMENLYGKDF
ncbi:SurA N-terminal domain-containing protein [Caloramator sp. mosi_1]|uniref:SurA N-terminal domain-containing protein n=1 Tax=Caloramator sp. mosi_1 TaxID=3023090 RepID=UPI002361E745|nr:SurA N-terminal domain-containing protein [Caloramator sp. mosi_1]WDC85466.1 SurA N-terminal domain-containing protein [Caloramator sp. mosi_1]